MTDRDAAADPSRPLDLATIRRRARECKTITLPTNTFPSTLQQITQLERDRDDLLAIADRLVADKAALAALAPLAKIADAYEANALDDEARRFWGSNNENENESPFSEITLCSGRGGGDLLTLADCFKARDALRNIPPTAPAIADRRAETVSVLEAAFGEYACVLLPKFNQKEHDEFERNFAVPARALLQALRIELWKEREAKS